MSDSDNDHNETAAPDDGADTGAADAGGQENAANVALPIAVNAQYVKDLSFENPNAPQSLSQLTNAPEVNVNVDVKANPVAENMFEVQLLISAKAENQGNVVFLIELNHAGVFTLAPKLREDVVRALLLVEAPRLLFPFARAVAAEATRNGGFPPLLVNPVDFAELYRRRYMQPQVQEAGAEKPAAAEDDTVGEPAGNA